MLRIARKILKPGKLRERLAVYEQSEVRSRLKMLLAVEDVVPIDRAEPGTGICLCQRQLVRDLDFLKCLIAFIFVKTNPPTVRVQTNPKNREG